MAPRAAWVLAGLIRSLRTGGPGEAGIGVVGPSGADKAVHAIDGIPDGGAAIEGQWPAAVHPPAVMAAAVQVRKAASRPRVGGFSGFHGSADATTNTVSTQNPPDRVDPQADDRARPQLLKRLAARRLAACPIPVEFIGVEGEALPLDDQSVDGALSTFTMCTIPDVARALRELHRVIRPGGELHFLEHGLSPDPRVARWQHRLTPIQRRLFGGCHFDRPVDQLIAASGFEITSLENHYLKGPKTSGYLYEGVARRA